MSDLGGVPMCRRYCWCLALFFLCCSCLVLPGVASDAAMEEPSASELPGDDPPSEDDGIDPQAGGRNYFIGSDSYLAINPEDGIFTITKTAGAGSVILAQLDLKEFMAEQGYLTAANMTKVEQYLSEISNKVTLLSNDLIGYFGELSAKLSSLDDKADTANTTLSTISSRISTTNSTLSTIRNYLSGSSSGPLTYIRDYLSGTRTGPLTAIRDQLKSTVNWSYDSSNNGLVSASGSRSLAENFDFRLQELDTLLLRNLSTTTLWRYDSETNTLVKDDEIPATITELVDQRSTDIARLLLKNFGTSFEFSYMTNSFGPPSDLAEGASFSELLSAIGSNLYYGTTVYSGYLGLGGSLEYASLTTTPMLIANGFAGLDLNIQRALVGGRGGSASYSKLTFDEKLNKVKSTVSYKDLLHAMVGIGSDLQNPLSQLQAVLAGDDDLELRKNVQDNVGSVTDNFTGDGAGSVSTGDISDAAGLTSGVGDAFGGNQVSTGDVFRVVGDADNYGFFSQATAEALDSVAYPAAMPLSFDDDSWLDAYSVDEDGFYYLSDTSSWNILDYLGRED